RPRQLHNRLQTPERAAHGGASANIADDELDGRIEVVGPRRAAVDLGVEAVQGANRMPGREQPVAQMRADESRPPGQEHLHAAPEASTAPGLLERNEARGVNAPDEAPERRTRQ